MAFGEAVDDHPHLAQGQKRLHRCASLSGRGGLATLADTRRGLGHARRRRRRHITLAFPGFDFAAAHADYPREKFIDIIRKTWRKMSDRGHALALTIPLPPGVAELVHEALA